MIHAFALEPEVVASWGRIEWYRFVIDKFGLGTPRVMLEIRSFHKWRRAVFAAAEALGLPEADQARVTELCRLFEENKCRRADTVYDGVATWLDNAEREFDRKPFKAIVATQNPRGHGAVIAGEELDPADRRWACPTGLTVERKAEVVAAALSAMLVNCRELHLVDPHFGPENPRHRQALERLLEVLAAGGVTPGTICIHCRQKSPLEFFEEEARAMARRLPRGLRVSFSRLDEVRGGEKLHNRYVLTDLGGVSLGVGIDAGADGQTDDIALLSADTYSKRWSQYVLGNGAFTVVDRPAPVAR